MRKKVRKLRDYEVKKLREKKDENREKRTKIVRKRRKLFKKSCKRKVNGKPRLIEVRDRLGGVVVGASCLNQKRHHLGATNGY